MPQLAPLLREHKEQAFARGFVKPTEFVFSSRVGTVLSSRNVSRRCVERAVELAELNVEGKPPVTMHTFRRTFASHLKLRASGLVEHEPPWQGIGKGGDLVMPRQRTSPLLVLLPGLVQRAL